MEYMNQKLINKISGQDPETDMMEAKLDLDNIMFTRGLPHSKCTRCDNEVLGDHDGMCGECAR